MELYVKASSSSRRTVETLVSSAESELTYMNATITTRYIPCRQTTASLRILSGFVTLEDDH